MKAVKRNFERGDKVIDVIGFSRGAAAAVHFANEVWEKLGKESGTEPAVRFLGLYDTVASTGFLPGKFDFNLDLDLPPNVRRCCHAMALDESRGSFHLHRMKERKTGTLGPDVIQEVWFRGCHSDIGGGKDHEKLANITLCWMMRQAAAVGVTFDEGFVAAALKGREPSGDIKRAKLDEGLKKRKPLTDDFVHRSVVAREGKHVNPPAGCHVIDDLGPECGVFPLAGEWPIPPEPTWAQALVPSAKLAVGEKKEVEVFADTEWNEFPPILLETGATYRFSVVDGPHGWTDGSVTETNGADGYELKKLEPFKDLARFPKAGWFALIGAVDRDELFPIRSKVDFTPSQTGEFGAFANDAWFRYENNRGRLTVSVERIA